MLDETQLTTANETEPTPASPSPRRSQLSLGLLMLAIVAVAIPASIVGYLARSQGSLDGEMLWTVGL